MASCHLGGHDGSSRDNVPFYHLPNWTQTTVTVVVDHALLYMALIAFKMHIDIIGKGYVVQWLGPKGLYMTDGEKKCMCMMLENAHTHMQ